MSGSGLTTLLSMPFEVTRQLWAVEVVTVTEALVT